MICETLIQSSFQLGAKLHDDYRDNRLAQRHPIPRTAAHCLLLLGRVIDSGLFSSFKLLKILQDFLSHRIFGCIHGTLNIKK
jgi:hypothetical protein